MNLAEIQENIRTKSRELGFDACRFTSAAPPASLSHYQSWIDSGSHGEMGYLARNMEKRAELGRILPDARSVVVVALNYYHGDRHESGGAGDATMQIVGKGRIARYAGHCDYHEVMGERLEGLARSIDVLAGEGGKPVARSLWYVDTGPILERDLAQRAGIGFVGKHTNLISRSLGNWFLIGEILTTVELGEETPEPNRCGSCTRCLSSCPTNAFDGPFRLDARKCISYLTIELKGSIPESMRKAMGSRIFGCDACLEVCPWNRFAREAGLMAEFRRRDLEMPDLLELLDLDDAEFRVRFRETPLWRTKRRGLLRNVCVALGNVGGREALEKLERATRDSEPLIVEHARWAMEQIEARHPMG